MLDDRRALDSYLNSRSPTVKDVQGHFVKDVLGLDIGSLGLGFAVSSVTNYDTRRKPEPLDVR